MNIAWIHQKTRCKEEVFLPHRTWQVADYSSYKYEVSVMSGSPDIKQKQLF